MWSGPELDAVHGMSAGELAAPTRWTQSNAAQVRKRLETLSHLQRVDGEKPARRIRRLS